MTNLKAFALSAVILVAGLGLIAGMSYASFGYLMAHAPEVPVDAAARLAQARAGLAKTGDADARWVHLADVAFWTVDTGDLRAAAALADEALAMAPAHDCDWNYGNVLHKANLTRGRIALRLHQPKAAAVFLLEAGRTPGSPQLDSFGPNMLLARELLEAGERDAVVQYIDLTSHFWHHDAGAIAAWKAMIAHGDTPNFAGNLLY